MAFLDRVIKKPRVSLSAGGASAEQDQPGQKNFSHKSLGKLEQDFCQAGADMFDRGLLIFVFKTAIRV